MSPPTGLTPAALMAVATLVAVTPVLAAWSASLADGVTGGWWRWRPAPWSWIATVGTSALILGVVTSRGTPWPAWLVFAAGGAVLAVVDVRVHLLPARLVYPWAGALWLCLVATAVWSGEWGRLLQAALATAAVTALWLTIALAAPTAFGIGDVRLFAVTAGLLGWSGWDRVVYGEALAFLLAGVTAVVAVLATKRTRSKAAIRVPMGPAIILGAALTTLL